MLGAVIEQDPITMKRFDVDAWIVKDSTFVKQ